MRGEHGHIGFSVNNMQRALAYLKRRGVGIIEETAQFDEQGIMRFVYTDLEVGGFAVHLRQL
jgi:2-dehydro-3-deoxyphosphogluconate aldolase/(4S)-4-hydroxy-2-oxoglutarate aldolase